MTFIAQKPLFISQDKSSLQQLFSWPCKSSASLFLINLGGYSWKPVYNKSNKYVYYRKQKASRRSERERGRGRERGRERKRERERDRQISS
jgi:hypothetical protein